MSRALTVSRAAQLVGVSRALLQRMIRAGELAQFDGLVEIDELLRAFPQASLEDSGAFERVARIREESFGRRVREHVLPSPEVLSQRLFACPSRKGSFPPKAIPVSNSCLCLYCNRSRA